MSGTTNSGEQHSRLIQQYIDRMPSLSTTVTKVLEICNQPNTSPNDLNRVISLDPVLTGQVIKLINSAYYSLPNQVTSLTRAIIMLGLNTVKNLALSTAILGTLQRQGGIQSLSMDRFWTHSICVGVAAKIIAGRLGVPAAMREEYFVAGLLHDLGKIPLSNCFSTEYQQTLDLASLEQGPLCRAERMMLGFDHGQVGIMIAEKWQLSEPLSETLACHHNIEAARVQHRKLVAIVALANMYANIFSIGSAGDFYQVPVEFRLASEGAGMPWHDLVELDSTIVAEIDKAAIFMQVARDGDI
jgi:putative nucleotidyltransferase with HDIG domain